MKTSVSRACAAPPHAIALAACALPFRGLRCRDGGPRGRVPHQGDSRAWPPWAPRDAVISVPPGHFLARYVFFSRVLLERIICLYKLHGERTFFGQCCGSARVASGCAVHNRLCLGASFRFKPPEIHKARRYGVSAAGRSALGLSRSCACSQFRNVAQPESTSSPSLPSS